MALVVPHEGADPVPGSNAEVSERAGELVGPVGDLGEGRLSDGVGAFTREDFRVAVDPTPVLHQRGDRQWDVLHGGVEHWCSCHSEILAGLV